MINHPKGSGESHVTFANLELFIFGTGEAKYFKFLMHAH